MSTAEPAERRPLGVVGVDVGTGSARAAVARCADGAILGVGKRAIRRWSFGGSRVEQSTTDIWRAACEAVREAVAEAEDVEIVGLAFDATCSLVAARRRDGRPASVGVVDDDDDCADERDVVVWMDRRATAEAAEISATRHEVLRLVGGAVSPEMEMPKLLWLRRRKGADWFRATHFFDLCDYLSARATGTLATAAATRSLCALVCKWNLDYGRVDGAAPRWRGDFLRDIALFPDADDVDDVEALAATHFGHTFATPGDRCGTIAAAAAADLGLPEGIAVAVGAIDAHAGGLACVGASGVSAAHGGDDAPSRRLAVIAGTSACHMATAPPGRPVFAPGVWGPYRDAMVPGTWLLEGGQSAAGRLLDAVLDGTLFGTDAVAAKATVQAVGEALAARAGTRPVAFLAANVHVDGAPSLETHTA